MRKSELSNDGKKLVVLMQSIHFGRLKNLAINDGRIVFVPETERIDDFKFGKKEDTKKFTLNNDFELKEKVVEFFQKVKEVNNGFIEIIEIKSGLPDISRIRRPIA